MRSVQALAGVLSSDRRLWWVAFVLFSSAGICWSWVATPNGGPDEKAQVIKAYAVAAGDLTSAAPGGGPRIEYEVPTAYRQLDTFPCFATEGLPASCAEPLSRDATPTRTRSYVGTYTPVYYALVGWPTRQADPYVGLYGMRAASSALTAALLASALVSARGVGRRPLLYAGFALALTPASLFLAGVVNPSGPEIAGALAFWTTSMLVLGATTRLAGDGMPAPSLRVPVPTRAVVRMGVVGCLLAVLRPLSPAFVVAIVVLVVLVAGPRAVAAGLRADRRLQVLGGALAATVLASVAWVVVFRSYDVIGVPHEGDEGTLGIVGISLSRTGQRAEQLIGLLGWGGFDSPMLPRWARLVWLGTSVAAVLAAGVVAVRARRWAPLLVLGLLVSAVVALPVVSETVGARTYGFSWQGRYHGPLAVGLPLVAAVILDRWGGLRRETSFRLAAGVIGVAAALHALAYASLAGFNLGGRSSNPFDAFSGGPWAGPVPLPVAVVAGVAVSLAGGVLLILLAWATVPSDTDRPVASCPLAAA
jgi:hypothetical protein